MMESVIGAEHSPDLVAQQPSCGGRLRCRAGAAVGGMVSGRRVGRWTGATEMGWRHIEGVGGYGRCQKEKQLFEKRAARCASLTHAHVSRDQWDVGTLHTHELHTDTHCPQSATRHVNIVYMHNVIFTPACIERRGGSSSRAQPQASGAARRRRPGRTTRGRRRARVEPVVVGCRGVGRGRGAR